jgi:hypothetical protein
LFYFNVLMMKIMIEGCINAFFLKELWNSIFNFNEQEINLLDVRFID